jgi:protease YdgD
MITRESRSAPRIRWRAGMHRSGIAWTAVLILYGASGAVAAPYVALATTPSVETRASLVRPVAVFGRDERVPVPASMRDIASKIGAVHDRRSHSVCTVFCVAPDVVATAAHCLYRTAEETPLRLSDLSVRLHATRNSSRIAGADRGAAEANVLAGSSALNVHPPIDATRDWALLRLAQPLCKGGHLPLSRRPVADVMRLADHGHVYNIAYHRDLPKWQPMLARPCAIQRSFDDTSWNTIRNDFTDPDELLLHTCDTGGASSGSPLLIDGPRGPEVVGVNVGTYVQSKVIMLNGEVVHRFKSDDVANTGVNSLAFAAALDSLRRADTLANRRDIRELQTRLAARGVYEGPRDGRFGADTRTAIERFERAAAMPVTGLATRPLLQTLAVDSRVVTGKIPPRHEHTPYRRRY